MEEIKDRLEKMERNSIRLKIAAVFIFISEKRI